MKWWTTIHNKFVQDFLSTCLKIPETKELQFWFALLTCNKYKLWFSFVFCIFFLLQHKQHYHGRRQHNFQRALHASHDERAGSCCLLCQEHCLQLLLGSLPRLLQLQPGPGRPHSLHTRGWAARRGSCYFWVFFLLCQCFALEWR